MKKILILLAFMMPVLVFGQKFKKVETDGIKALDQTKKTITIEDTLKFPDGSKMISTNTVTAELGLMKNGNKIGIDTASEWVARTIYVSMPTDPQTPGSDITGNGTSSHPYATINKALKSIHPYLLYGVVTVQLDSGTFTMSINDKLEIVKLNNFTNFWYASPRVQIKGTYNMRATPLTMTKIMSNTFTYTGTPYTTDILEGCFFGTTTTVTYPIEGNVGDTIFSPNYNITLQKYIFDYYTTITILSDQILNYEQSNSLSFFNCNIEFPNSQHIDGVYFGSDNLNFRQTTGFNLSMLNTRIANSKINTYLNVLTQEVIVATEHCEITYGVIKNKAATKTIGLRWMDYCQMSDLIFSNYNVAINYIGDVGIVPKTTGIHFLFKNCDIAFSNKITSSGTINAEVNDISLKNTKYLLRNYSTSSPIKLVSQTITGAYTSIYDPASLTKDLSNPGVGTYINIPNIYPEYQQRIPFTLTNNATDSISIGDLSYNRSIDIDYNIVRGTTYSHGSMKILNTGTAYLIDPGDLIQSASTGVTFNGVYRSGVSNTLKLGYTTTNTGTAATMTCDFKRQNY